MRANRLSKEFDNGVNEFLQFAEQNLPNNDGFFPCPCVSCAIREPNITTEEIRGIQFGTRFVKLIHNGYGTVKQYCQVYPKERTLSVDMDDRLEDMIHDIGEESFKRAHVYDTFM